MRTHQRIGLLAGCLALATLHLPQCLGIATCWPCRPSLASAPSAQPAFPVLLQAAALSKPLDRTDGAPQDRAQVKTPESDTWVEGQ